MSADKDIISDKLSFLAQKITMEHPEIVKKYGRHGKLTKEVLDNFLKAKNVLQGNGRPVPGCHRERWFGYVRDARGISHFAVTQYGEKQIIKLLNSKPVKVPGTPEEKSDAERLNYLEDVIRQGMDSFIRVGAALLEIREKKLYRLHSETFEEYMQERFGFTRQRGNQLMSGVKTIIDVDYGGDISAINSSTMVVKSKGIIKNERMARPLDNLNKKLKIKIAKTAQKKATKEGRETTSKDIQEAVDDYKSHKVGLKQKTAMTDKIKKGEKSKLLLMANKLEDRIKRINNSYYKSENKTEVLKFINDRIKSISKLLNKGYGK